jgi:serine/threonine protein kinase
VTTRCQVCGTQNAESIEECQRCGARLAASPTMSISPDELAQGDRRTAVGPVSTPNRSLAFNFAPASMVADRYRVASLLGRGGMGEVYGADDLKLGQRVALKFLPMDRGKSTSWRDQFYAEVRMARQVSHPNVCRVYDVGESDGRLFLSMEFVDGEDLASLLPPDDTPAGFAQHASENGGSKDCRK